MKPSDLEAELKTVLRATVAELNDPHYDEPMRALNTEFYSPFRRCGTFADCCQRP